MDASGEQQLPGRVLVALLASVELARREMVLRYTRSVTSVCGGLNWPTPLLTAWRAELALRQIEGLLVCCISENSATVLFKNEVAISGAG